VFSAASLGFLSRSVYVDLIAWWPVWIGLIGLAILLQLRPLGSIRPGGLVALLGSVAAVLFLLGHLSGWALMPSASARLVGPEASEVEVASLTAVINGRVDVISGPGFLYEVYPIRWGGSYGLPGAFEAVPNPQTVDVTLVAPADPGRMGFAGWEIFLATGPTWTLDLGGVVSADLSELDVIELVLGGSGEVELGGTEFPRQVTVSGVFQLRFPPGVPILVTGEATVPEGWIETDEGWRSPHDGEVWRVTVEPGSVATIATP
jgi:hypothetical protein